jgi:hypothetical protein
MAIPVFSEGIPARITIEYFRRRYGQNFPDLLSDEYNELLYLSIEDVYTMFVGVNTLWSAHEEQVWFDKTQLCFSHLVAWYITDLHPQFAVGVMTSGGIPLKSKAIGGVKIMFGNPDTDNDQTRKGYKDNLNGLKSNPFGYKAYMMIKSAHSITAIRGRKAHV